MSRHEHPTEIKPPTPATASADAARTDAANVTRREFIRAAATTGAGLMAGGISLGLPAHGQAPAADVAATSASTSPGAAPPELRVAIIGVGREGYNLINNALRIPGIRFTAVCDIWPFRADRAANLLKKYRQEVKVYENYQDMLAAGGDFEAVIIATPDWMHGEHTIACLKAGHHVYCEKGMAHAVEDARAMVLAQRETGKLLQIGHQRRSEPRYLHALKLIYNDKILGRVVRVQGQWHRPVTPDEISPKGKELPAEVLARYGYASMEQFLNWHWYKKYSGGPIGDLGSHQIDVFSWFLRANPSAVMASGGNENYPRREWYDNIIALYEYPGPQGLVRANYSILNSNGHGDFWEMLMGDEGTLQISENDRIGNFWKEPAARTREWEEHSETSEVGGREAYTLKIGETLDPSGRKTPEAEKLLDEAKKPGWQLHLENFFAAVRDGGRTPLNCPPDVAFATCVAVLKANEALAKQARVEFKPEDFVA